MFTRNLIVLAIAILSETSVAVVPFKNVKIVGYSIYNQTFEVTLNPSGKLKDSIPRNLAYDALEIRFQGSGLTVLPEGWIADLEDLTEINLSGNFITQVKPGVFRNVPYLDRINLAHNQLAEIEVGVFNGLNVGKIDLSNNHLKTIHSDAFDNLRNLNTIDLSDNQIQEWDPEWFKDSPDITRVYMNKNLIKHLPAEAFRNFDGDKRPREANSQLTLDFSNNKIKELQPDIFEGLSRINHLWLNGNRIQNIDGNVFQYLNMDTLRMNDNQIECLPLAELRGIFKAKSTELDGNPWNCTCLGEIKKWVQKNGHNVALTYSTMQCRLEEMNRRLTALENSVDE